MNIASDFTRWSGTVIGVSPNSSFQLFQTGPLQLVESIRRVLYSEIAM